MNKISIYSSLPYWLQDIAISIHGYNLKKTRYNETFHQLKEFLSSTQNWNKEKIIAYKEENIAKILELSYVHCPFYNKKYKKAGLSPRDFKSLEDIKKFPILTKEEVRHNWAGMVSDIINKRDLILYHTSGSTGTALDFYWTKYSAAFYWAVDQRYKDRFGFNLGQLFLNFTGKPIIPITASKPPFWRYDSALNRYFLTMQQISPTKIKDIVNWLEGKNLNFFVGYPSIMTSFANEMINQGLSLTCQPTDIFTGAEKVYSNQKAILLQAFPGVKIHELYSFSEQAAIATHCKHGVYHEDFEIGHMELTKTEHVKSGTKGEILATGFANYGMPFIRYKNGDTAIFSERTCNCGLQSQIIEDIVGRNEDYIITPEGLHIQRLDYIFKGTNNIKECQVVQNVLNELLLRIVKRPNYRESTEIQLKQNISQLISPLINVKFEYVDEIERTKAGKFRAVVSNLNNQSTNE